MRPSAMIVAAALAAIAIAPTMWPAVRALADKEEAAAADEIAAEQITAEQINLDVPSLVRPRYRPALHEAKKLRQRFGFESLADRLAYEGRPQPGKNGRDGGKTQPLSAAAEKSLDAMEKSIESQRRFDLRTRALQALHSDRVEQFIRREGFGLARLPTPTPSHLELPDSAPIQFASLSSSAIEQAGPHAMPLPATLSDRGEAPSRLPSLSMLAAFHAGSQSDFLDISRWGMVKDKQRVAGFAGHAFSHLPQVVEPRNTTEDRRPAQPDPTNPWQVTRLELVSLLKHDRPRVYVSDQLPRMAELDNAKTRGLSRFEQTALEALQTGDELAVDARLNQIYMLGAVRATTQCLECHDVQRGDLLGAFSYELRRDPPVKPARKPAA